MKAAIQRLDSLEIRKTYPIQDKVIGWFFRTEETSNGVYEVEGTDLYGRKVSRNGTDPDLLLDRCAGDAREILKNENHGA